MYYDLNAVNKCLDYILSHERDDFYQNPSATHIYFLAVKAVHGVNEAKTQYEDAYEMMISKAERDEQNVIEEIKSYCEKYKDYMWAAKILGMINKTDFRGDK